jgi:hypothetical protein
LVGLAACDSCKSDLKADKPTAPASASAPLVADDGHSPPCRNDASKKIGPDGRLQSCVLMKPYVIDDFTCEWGKAFELHPNGKLRTCYLREAKTVDGISCHDHVSFYESGKLERCRVYSNKKDIIEGVDARVGDWVTLYESGKVKRLELIIAPATIQGVTCKGHQNFFWENGKLKQCELAAPDGGEKMVCFDEQGKKRPDCS